MEGEYYRLRNKVIVKSTPYRKEAVCEYGNFTVVKVPLGNTLVRPGDWISLVCRNIDDEQNSKGMAWGEDYDVVAEEPKKLPKGFWRLWRKE